jgi:hypothetical protein
VKSALVIVEATQGVRRMPRDKLPKKDVQAAICLGKQHECDDPGFFIGIVRDEQRLRGLKNPSMFRSGCGGLVLK